MALAPAVWGGVELAHRLAAGREFPPGAAGRAPDVVLVLGCPPHPDGSTTGMQRWRTEIAARTSATALLVFSGYARDGGPSEAAVMAEHAQRVLGVAPDRVRREEAARTTWENVAFTVADLAAGGHIAIASTPLHALRARRYLRRQRPDLAQRLVPAADYRFGERWGWKAMTLLYDVGRSLRLRLDPRHRRTTGV